MSTGVLRMGIDLILSLTRIWVLHFLNQFFYLLNYFYFFAQLRGSQDSVLRTESLFDCFLTKSYFLLKAYTVLYSTVGGYVGQIKNFKNIY